MLTNLNKALSNELLQTWLNQLKFKYIFFLSFLVQRKLGEAQWKWAQKIKQPNHLILATERKKEKNTNTQRFPNLISYLPLVS